MKILNKFYKVANFIIVFIVFTGCASMPQHFNDEAINEEKNSCDVIPYLEIKKGDVVADLGAGGGYFSVKLARAVGESGKIFAVDIDRDSIEYIKRIVKEQGIHTIEAVHASPEDSKLKPGSCNLIFVRNTYHDIQNRIPYFSRLKNNLKPNGVIVIIDYDPGKLGFFRKLFGHALEEKKIIDEMRQAGYVVKNNHNILMEQSFNIFIVK